MQQQAQYGGPGTVGGKNAQGKSNPSNGLTYAYCGELVITAGNGKQSIDTVTVTIGGKAPDAHRLDRVRSRPQLTPQNRAT